MDANGWNSRSLGSKYKHAFFYAMIRWFGLGPARGFLYVVVFYYSLLPSVLRRSRPYLKRRFPGAAGFRLWLHSFRLNRTFGLVLLERAALGLIGRATTVPDGNEKQSLAGLLAEGHGLLILTAHVGGWQLAMSGLSECGAPVNIVQLRDAGDIDRHYFEHGAAFVAPTIIDAADPVASLGLASSALLRGEVVCLMGDRVRAGDSLALETEFLGDAISVPGSPYYLAGRLGCPLVVFFSPRRGASRVVGKEYAVLRVGREAGRDPAKLTAYARQFTTALEQFVREYPYQFFNFYDLWLKGEGNGGH